MNPNYHAFHLHANECERCERARPKYRWTPDMFPVSYDLACDVGKVLLKRWRDSVYEALLEATA